MYLLRFIENKFIKKIRKIKKYETKERRKTEFS